MTRTVDFDAPVIAHEGVRRRILETNMEEHLARVTTFGPEEPKLLEGYHPNAPIITFKNGMTLHVGNHTFQMIHMPGHTAYQAAICIKEKGWCSPVTTSSTKYKPDCRRRTLTCGWSRSNH